MKAGDRLFEITSPLLKARLDAELAERDLAQVELNRNMKLVEQKAVADDEVKLSKAKLAKAEDKVNLVKTKLAFATFKAPFDGVVGRLNVPAGSNVKEGDELMELYDNSVLWVYFMAPEKGHLESVAGPREGEGTSAIELMLGDRRKFPHPGKLGAIEVTAKDGNGMIAHRADFPNPDGLLQGVQTGTVSIERVLKDAIVIPERATFEDHGKRYVYLVESDNVARKRNITVRAVVDDGFIVESGDQGGRQDRQRWSRQGP